MSTYGKKAARKIRGLGLCVLLAAELSLTIGAQALSDDKPSLRPFPASDSGLYLKVLLANPMKTAKLKPGDLVDGTLSRDVYAADHKMFSAGSHVQLTVERLERRRRTRNDHWPWVVNAFTPRHENYPVFDHATVTEGGSEVGLRVSMISISRMREIHAQGKKRKSAVTSAEDLGAVDVSHSNLRKPATPTMVLEAFRSEDSVETNNRMISDADSEVPIAIQAGTRCKILLLGNVSASKSRPGDTVQARLLEPVLQDGKVVLPAGSLFEGKVVRRTPPRWLSRAGSLYLTFTQVTLAKGIQIPIAASPAGAELDRSSHTRMDAEGGLHGERPGAAWMAINIGMSGGIAKEVDDGVQLVIEAIVSTATDASTAGTARIVSSCISGLYMATRRGRDVVLPRFSEMDIMLDRPLTVGGGARLEAASEIEDKR